MRSLLASKNFSSTVEISKAIGGEAPGWARPYVTVLAFFALLLVTLATLPFFLIWQFFRKEQEGSFTKLRTDLETKWYTESSHAALDDLRKIAMELKEHEGSLFLRGHRIPLYGKFKFQQYLAVLNLLFHWEFRHENLAEAEVICDRMIGMSSGNGQKNSRYFADWIVNKAKVIRKAKGNVAAQKFLLQHLDPKNPENPINAYLESIKKQAKEVV